MLHRELLHGTLVDFLAAATRLVGYSDHTDDVVLPFQKSLQRSHREFRCAHIDNPCFLNIPANILFVFLHQFFMLSKFEMSVSWIAFHVRNRPIGRSIPADMNAPATVLMLPSLANLTPVMSTIQ